MIRSLRKFAYLLPLYVSRTDRFLNEDLSEDSATNETMNNVFRYASYGYKVSALRDGDFSLISSDIEENVPTHFKGFAYESYGAYLLLNDYALIGRKKETFLESFFAHSKTGYETIMRIGAGVVLTALPFYGARFGSLRSRLSLHTQHWIINGTGFGDYYLKKQVRVSPTSVPTCENDVLAFYNGVGRSFWFQGGGNFERIGEMIASYPPDVRPYIWGGVGFAFAYAGEIPRSQFPKLESFSAKDQAHFLAYGLFASRGRSRCGNVSDWTNEANRYLAEFATTQKIDYSAAFDVMTDATNDIHSTILSLSEKVEKEAS